MTTIIKKTMFSNTSPSQANSVCPFCHPGAPIASLTTAEMSASKERSLAVDKPYDQANKRPPDR